MKPIMNSRRINTPFMYRPKETTKKANNESFNPENTSSPIKKNGVKISKKSRNSPLSNVPGCTAYPKGTHNQTEDNTEYKRKSPIRKKVIIPMHKTTFNWAIKNQHTYGNVKGNAEGINKKRGCELPEIPFKENAKFIPHPVSEKRDEYIRYIANSKKSALGAREDYNKIRNFKLKDVSIDSARGNGMFSNESKTHSFSLGGVNFEVQSKCDTSVNSLEHMRTDISKEMNLMFYDFNGSKKRIDSGLPRHDSLSPNKKRVAYPNKTTNKFFQRRNLSDKQSNTNSFNDIKNCEDDYKEKQNFTPLANDSNL